MRTEAAGGETGGNLLGRNGGNLMRRLLADVRWHPGRGAEIPEWRARLNQVRSSIPVRVHR